MIDDDEEQDKPQEDTPIEPQTDPTEIEKDTRPLDNKKVKS